MRMEGREGPGGWIGLVRCFRVLALWESFGRRAAAFFVGQFYHDCARNHFSPMMIGSTLASRSMRPPTCL